MIFTVYWNTGAKEVFESDNMFTAKQRCGRYTGNLPLYFIEYGDTGLQFDIEKKKWSDKLAGDNQCKECDLELTVPSE